MSFITNLNQQQRKRLHQITLVATFGGLLFGYDTGVINGAFSSLKQYMALTPTTEGLVMSVLLVGAALGSVFGGKFADYFGRRKYLLFLSFVFLIGALLSAAAPDITTLLIARALLGYAVGGASVTAPTFISEVAPTEMRGKLTGLNEVAIVIGRWRRLPSTRSLASSGAICRTSGAICCWYKRFRPSACSLACGARRKARAG